MFLSAAASPIGADAWKSVLDALTAQISVTTVVGVLAVLAGVAVGFAFMWWGVRKMTRVLMSAFKKGKVSL